MTVIARRNNIAQRECNCIDTAEQIVGKTNLLHVLNKEKRT